MKFSELHDMFRQRTGRLGLCMLSMWLAAAWMMSAPAPAQPTPQPTPIEERPSASEFPGPQQVKKVYRNDDDDNDYWPGAAAGAAVGAVAGTVAGLVAGSAGAGAGAAGTSTAAIAAAGIITTRSSVLVIQSYEGDPAGPAALAKAGIALPNLEGMVRDGVRFSNAYNQAPANADALIRFERAAGEALPQSTAMEFPTEQIALAEALKAKGFNTGMTGYTGEATSFIDRNGAARRFFTYVALNAPDAPIEVGAAHTERVQGIEDAAVREQAAKIVAIDDAVGKILNTLRENGVEKDTLIFFIGDTGSALLDKSALRRSNGDLYEGDLRVPFVMQWNGVLPESKVYGNPVVVTKDVPATALAATGAATEGEGVNLIPYILGQVSSKPYASLAWQHSDKRAFRQGDWKLVQNGVTQKPELYNLAKDSGERNNLAKAMPEKLMELEMAFYEYQNGPVTPQDNVHMTTKEQLVPAGGL